MSDDGWSASADSWIRLMGEHGDNGRRYVLDPALLARIDAGRHDGNAFSRVLDVGCGEGRFSRLLRARGLTPVGIDPTPEFIERARTRDPESEYHLGRAESLPFDDAAFDLVISCMTLCDIPDYRRAIAEMARVLAPGGALLAANLTAHQSAGMRAGWQYDDAGTALHFGIDDYSDEWWAWQAWGGVRVKNWHRPLRAYMQAFLGCGLTLTFFDEPEPIAGYTDKQNRNHRAPWFNLMQWTKG